MGDPGHGMFLGVIRWQPMIFRADKGLEERPGLSRNLVQEEGLIRRQSRGPASEWSTDPPGDRRRENQRPSIGPATHNTAGFDNAR